MLNHLEKNWIVVATLAFMGACGATPLSTAAVARAKSSISAAEAVGADEHPPAALHMKLARDGIEDAERLAKEGEEEEAARLLDRAEADAQLGLSLTREEAMRKEAAEAIEQISALAQE